MKKAVSILLVVMILVSVPLASLASVKGVTLFELCARYMKRMADNDLAFDKNPVISGSTATFENITVTNFNTKNNVVLECEYSVSYPLATQDEFRLICFLSGLELSFTREEEVKKMPNVSYIAYYLGLVRSAMSERDGPTVACGDYQVTAIKNETTLTLKAVRLK